MVLNARSNEEQRALDLLMQDRQALKQFEHVVFQPIPQHDSESKTAAAANTKTAVAAVVERVKPPAS